MLTPKFDKDELTYQESVILQKCEKILEVFRDMIEKQGIERPEGELLLDIGIWKDGRISVFAIKHPGTEELNYDEQTYYANFRIAPDEDENGGAE